MEIIIILSVIGGLILLLLFYVISFYNSVKTKLNNIENSFAQIDVVLKKRADLIPNIVETVKGYTKHENQTLKDIIALRNAAVSSKNMDESINNNGALTSALKGLNVVVEQYPDLKANTNFLNLQTQLQDIEKQIAHYRQFFNDTILIYNRKIEIFPNSILAGMFHFNKKPYLETAAADRENVKVSF